MGTNFLMVRYRMIWGIFFLSTLTSIKYGSAQTFTLQQILDSVDAHNPGLQQFELKSQSANAMGQAAKAWMAPTIGAGLSEFPYPAENKMGNTMAPRKMLMLQIQQMFPNFHKQKKEEAYYQSYAAQNQDDRATMENMLFAKAKLAYVDAYIAEKKLNIIAVQDKQLQLLIQLAEGRLAYNQASLPDIYKARAKLSELQAQRVKINSVVRESAAIINSLMGRPVELSLEIDTSKDLAQQQVNILQVDSSYLLAHRSDLRHTLDDIHSMKLKKDLTRAGERPVFGITWDNMRMDNNSYMYSAMATLSIPIVPWFSKGYKSEIYAIDYQIQAKEKMKDNLVQETLGTIRKDWLKLQSAQKALQLFQTKVIPAYDQTFQATLNSFRENTGDLFKTLIAWNDLTMKKMEYYDKLSDMLGLRILLETELQGTD